MAKRKRNAEWQPWARPIIDQLRRAGFSVAALARHLNRNEVTIYRWGKLPEDQATEKRAILEAGVASLLTMPRKIVNRPVYGSDVEDAILGAIAMLERGLRALRTQDLPAVRERDAPPLPRQQTPPGRVGGHRG